MNEWSFSQRDPSRGIAEVQILYSEVIGELHKYFAPDLKIDHAFRMKHMPTLRQVILRCILNSCHRSVMASCWYTLNNQIVNSSSKLFNLYMYYVCYKPLSILYTLFLVLEFAMQLPIHWLCQWLKYHYDMNVMSDTTLTRPHINIKQFAYLYITTVRCGFHKVRQQFISRSHGLLLCIHIIFKFIERNSIYNYMCMSVYFALCIMNNNSYCCMRDSNMYYCLLYIRYLIKSLHALYHFHTAYLAYHAVKIILTGHFNQ